jgi:M6 family metalloprotease-like protein
MPKPSTAYGFADGDTLDEQVAYMRQAISLANPRFDFHGAEELYVVSSRGAALPASPALVGGPGVGLHADGTKFGFGATFGNDIRAPGDSYRYGPWILEHETGHTLGLPDLYRIPSTGDVHTAVGAWDPMGDLFRGTALMAWHRRKLGWLTSDQQVCLRKPGASVTTTLAPLDRAGGHKLLIVKLDRDHAYSVEVRRPVGTDAGLCGSGVLISAIYGQRDTGNYPIVVERAAPAPPGVDNDCGVTTDAAFGLGPGRVSRFEKGRVTVVVLAVEGDGYRVRATLRH